MESKGLRNRGRSWGVSGRLGARKQRIEEFSGSPGHRLPLPRGGHGWKWEIVGAFPRFPGTEGGADSGNHGLDVPRTARKAMPGAADQVERRPWVEDAHDGAPAREVL